MVMNGLVLFAIHRDPLRCFRTPTSIFIFNLAVSDLLTNCINACELLVSLTNFRGLLGIPNPMGKILFYVYECVFFTPFPSVFIIAVERYLAVSRPLWHNVYLTRRLCYYWVVVIWLVIFGYTGTIIVLVTFNVGMTYYYIVQSCLTTLLFCGTIIIYFLAIQSIRRQRQSIDNVTSEVGRYTSKVRLKNQNNFLNTLLIVIFFMILGLIPNMTANFAMDIMLTLEHSIGMEFLLVTLDIFHLLNNAINPLLYFLRLQKYRKTFLVLYWKNES